MPEHTLEERLPLPTGSRDGPNALRGCSEPPQRAILAEIFPIREVPREHPTGIRGAAREPRATNSPKLVDNLRRPRDPVIGLSDALLDFRREPLRPLRSLD
jgi:hypothetical protein